MKKSLTAICRILYIPTCFLMIIYCVLYQYIIELPCIFTIKLILFLSFIFQTLINLFDKTKERNHKISNKPIMRKMYLYSRQIITWTFNCYFAIYLIFFLDKKSVLYNYIVLVLFGLFVGYEIAIIASRYKKN